tara:strand:+ start:432 stop:839 length:408 start_codon:yes stop_codon:yes gene_type:complete
MSKITDLQFGMEMETKTLTLLKEKVNKNITQTLNFHSFDYFCSESNTYYELKSRRVKHDAYADTMCGYNKLKWAKQHPENKYVFLFQFTDGLYYHDWKADKKYSVRKGGRCDRGSLEIADYFFIKKTDLLKFDYL